MSMPPSVAQLHISHDALRHNMDALRSWLKPHVVNRPPRIWAVVKADAYGHGLAGTLPALQDADGLAVSDLNDAGLCRANGWRRPILLLAQEADWAALFDPHLTPLHVTVQCPSQIQRLQAHLDRPAARRGTAAGPYIWLRSAGMLNHGGLAAADYRDAFARLAALRDQGHLAGVGHMVHYANAENPQSLASERQAFQALIQGLGGAVCSENSASLLSDPGQAARTDWVRSGIALYGVNPLGNDERAGPILRPAMALHAPIYAIRHLEAGDAVGYGATFVAPHAMRIGLVRCGYGDGYPRHARSGCPVDVHGKRLRLVGRVSMDTLTIDLRNSPEARAGDRATLWGSPVAPIQSVAAAADTIAAQLFTAVTMRVTRVHHAGASPAEQSA